MILILKIQEVKPDKVKGLVQGYIAKDSRDVNGGASGSHTQALSSPPSASAAEHRGSLGLPVFGQTGDETALDLR